MSSWQEVVVCRRHHLQHQSGHSLNLCSFLGTQPTFIHSFLPTFEFSSNCGPLCLCSNTHQGPTAFLYKTQHQVEILVTLSFPLILLKIGNQSTLNCYFYSYVHSQKYSSNKTSDTIQKKQCTMFKIVLFFVQLFVLEQH